MSEREHTTHAGQGRCHDIEGDPSFLGSDHPAAAAFRAFMRVLHLHRRLILQALGDAGSHPAQAICLRRLSAEDGLAQKELADEMFLTPPTVSRMLKTMEQSGVIERRPDAGDQRVTRVYLTANGRQLAEQLREVTARYVVETFGSLADEDLRELARLLDRLSARLQGTAGRRAAEAERHAVEEEPRPAEDEPCPAEDEPAGDAPDEGPAGGDPAHHEEEPAP